MREFSLRIYPIMWHLVELSFCIADMCMHIRNCRQFASCLDTLLWPNVNDHGAGSSKIFEMHRSYNDRFIDFCLEKSWLGFVELLDLG